MTGGDRVDAYCRRVVEGAANNEIVLAIAERMTDDELTTRSRDGWFILGGRWLHS